MAAAGRALVRRRAGGDAGHAGHLGRDHRHVRGGEQRVLAARHVAADRIDRDVLVAEDDAGQGLDLDVAQRLPLEGRRSCAPAPGRSGCPRCRGGTAGPGSRRSRRRSAGSPRGPSCRSGSESSRTAASPRASMSARMASTVWRTLLSCSATTARSMPRFNHRAIDALREVRTPLAQGTNEISPRVAGAVKRRAGPRSVT